MAMAKVTGSWVPIATCSDVSPGQMSCSLMLVAPAMVVDSGGVRNSS